ncbi:MAG: hypothetical protein ACOVRM_17320, partial [Planctomycetaceae bacterium]
MNNLLARTVLKRLLGCGLGVLAVGFRGVSAQEPISLTEFPAEVQPAVAEPVGAEQLDLARDGAFSAPGYAQTTLVRTQRKVGDWQVDLGDVDVLVGEYRPPGYRGNVIDLNGTRSGSIYQ